MDFVLCAQIAGGKYNMLFGRDEILLSALVTGTCEGDVGSTLNYMTFNLDVRKAYEEGDLKTAKRHRSFSPKQWMLLILLVTIPD